MGRTVINETENKQTVILNDSPEGVEGGYFDSDMEWHELGESSGEWTTAGFIEGKEPSGNIVYEGSGPVKLGCFANNSAITSFFAPNVSVLRDNAFSYAANLKKIYIGGTYTGSTSQVGAYMVRGCASLEELRIPYSNDRLAFGGYAFDGCKNLKLVELGTHANNLAFSNLPADTPLEILIIRGTTAHTLTSGTLSASAYFKQGGTGGKLYVPSSLVETYKTLGGWSTYYNYGTMEILPIEGSEYEL